MHCRAVSRAAGGTQHRGHGGVQAAGCAPTATAHRRQSPSHARRVPWAPVRRRRRRASTASRPGGRWWPAAPGRRCARPCPPRRQTGARRRARRARGGWTEAPPRPRCPLGGGCVHVGLWVGRQGWRARADGQAPGQSCTALSPPPTPLPWPACPPILPTWPEPLAGGGVPHHHKLQQSGGGGGSRPLPTCIGRGIVLLGCWALVSDSVSNHPPLLTTSLLVPLPPTPAPPSPPCP